MSFAENNLSVLAYANGFTIWHYRTRDRAFDVVGDNYFNPAVNMLRVGDQIIINAEDWNETMYCTINDGKVVGLRTSGLIPGEEIPPPEKVYDEPVVVFQRLLDTIRAADSDGNLPKGMTDDLIQEAEHALQTLRAA